ncbi:MAG TPA: NrtA/SsuA/CpmA family ABC transporter substrate-binding protein [Chloroflexota bacterium]|jgi:ABC-type nitrate/sulfonate/bicarbonate transport system substrate-binding protein
MTKLARLAMTACLALVACQAPPSRDDRPAAQPAAAAAAPTAPPSAAGAPPPAAGPLQKVTVAYVAPVETFSIPWIAREAGIFTKYGLDGEVALLTGSPRLIQSLIAGDFDYGLAGVTAIMRARMQGADPVMLAAGSRYSSQAVLVPQGSGIQRLQDLHGKTVGVAQYGSESETFLQFALGKAGMRADDVQVLQTGGHPQTLAALMSGNLESGVLASSMVLAAERAGAVRLTDGRTMQVLSPGAPMATTRRLVERDRDGVRRYMRAYVEAIQYFKTQREDTIRILQQYMGGLPPEEMDLIYESARTDFDSLPMPGDDAVQAVLDREDEPEAKDFKPADFVDTSFLREIEESGFLREIGATP